MKYYRQQNFIIKLQAPNPEKMKLKNMPADTLHLNSRINLNEKEVKVSSYSLSSQYIKPVHRQQVLNTSLPGLVRSTQHLSLSSSQRHTLLGPNSSSHYKKTD